MINSFYANGFVVQFIYIFCIVSFKKFLFQISTFVIFVQRVSYSNLSKILNFSWGLCRFGKLYQYALATVAVRSRLFYVYDRGLIFCIVDGSPVTYLSRHIFEGQIVLDVVRRQSNRFYIVNGPTSVASFYYWPKNDGR